MISRRVWYLLVFALIAVRVYYTDFKAPQPVQVITWDAFGYYLILPGIFIYKDIKKMDWVTEVNQTYGLSGTLYQIGDVKNGNGNKVMRYLLGISILYSPFFLLGHLASGIMGFPQDGFSLPYNLAICLAALFYAALGLWVLRKILLRYFTDTVTAGTILLVVLATNYVQYVSIDSGQTHGYIFTLYALLLLLVIRWHERPEIRHAWLIGVIIGLGTISRPTELVMLFIPLLFHTHTESARKQKWDLVRKHRLHILYLALGTFLGGLPQLIYWKIVTGGWIHEVGSRWVFFKPNWQVLFGWEKGWFVYTPVVMLMVVGLLYLRKHPAFRSILVFFILNTWIVIAWYDWRYGASYSTRALVQSYAVMALPMAAAIDGILTRKLKWLGIGIGLYLIGVNLLQIWQYNKTILHYNDMNRKYYQAIYLNPNPSPLQMSLLDTREYIRNREAYTTVQSVHVDSQFLINNPVIPKAVLFESELQKLDGYDPKTQQWIIVNVQVLSAWGAFETDLVTSLTTGDQQKDTRVRMQNGISEKGVWNDIQYYYQIPPATAGGRLTVYAETKISQDIYLRNFSIALLEKKP